VQGYIKTAQGYASEVQALLSQSSMKVADYQAKAQTEGMLYQWRQDQYNKLKAEYDAAFMIAAPKQQAQA
jgi:hypothetical protein